jgi:hypothetical protein
MIATPLRRALVLTVAVALRTDSSDLWLLAGSSTLLPRLSSGTAVLDSLLAPT